MKLLLITALIVLCVLPFQAEEMQKVAVGDITISYPPGLETQANDLANISNNTLLPRLEKFRRLEGVFTDSDRVARRIGEILGTPEHVGLARDLLAEMAVTVDAVVTQFTNLRVYRDSDLRAAGGLKEGPVEIYLDRRTNFFASTFIIGSNTRDFAKKVFLPIVVNDDGTFQTSGSLEQNLARYFDQLSVMPVGPFHEATEKILIEGLKLYHPFTRWFNDGVANWVSLKVISEQAPETRETFEGVFLPGGNDESLRPKINLLTWTQEAYQKQSLTPEEERVEEVSYRFATKSIDQMMAGKPSDTLAKVIGKLKGKPKPDTDTICAAIKEVTGVDFKSILLEYVPEDVRKGIASGEAGRLLAEARSAYAGKDLKRIEGLLDRALEMDPGNPDARFNLAFVMRKLGMPKPESERQLAITFALVESSGGEHDLDPLDKDDPEAVYLLALLTHAAGDPEKAKSLLRDLLSKSPSHPDAKSTLEEWEQGK
jgi:hypothetical protein